MEKLIELLNEYEPYIQSDGTHTDNFWWYVSQGHSAVFPKEVGIDRIISNEYGFIKWLIGNDKIEINKLREESFNIGLSLSSNFRKNKNGGLGNYFECKLLMLLAIQDEPVEFLLSILK